MNYFNQQSLLLSIVQFVENKLQGNKGLAIYQQNYLLNAANALSISYPTIYLLLGSDLFTILTKQFLIKHPKRSYDWALWGQDFPQWLAWHPISIEFKYLCDCAKLDWAIHLNSKITETSINLESIQLIENDKLDKLIIQFNNGTHLLNRPIQSLISIMHTRITIVLI